MANQKLYGLKPLCEKYKITQVEIIRALDKLGYGSNKGNVSSNWNNKSVYGRKKAKQYSEALQEIGYTINWRDLLYD